MQIPDPVFTIEHDTAWDANYHPTGEFGIVRVGGYEVFRKHFPTDTSEEVVKDETLAEFGSRMKWLIQSHAST